MRGGEVGDTSRISDSRCKSDGWAGAASESPFRLTPLRGCFDDNGPREGSFSRISGKSLGVGGGSSNVIDASESSRLGKFGIPETDHDTLPPDREGSRGVNIGRGSVGAGSGE